MIEVSIDHISFEESEEKSLDNQRVNEKKAAPWLQASTIKIANPNVKLHIEIIDFYEFIKPSNADH